MPPDQLLPLLLGPAGALIAALVGLYKFQKGDWVPRERLDEMRAQRDKALELVDKAIGGTEGITTAIAERNRLEAVRIEELRASRSLSQDLAETESRIRRRSPRQ